MPLNVIHSCKLSIYVAVRRNHGYVIYCSHFLGKDENVMSSIDWNNSEILCLPFRVPQNNNDTSPLRCKNIFENV